MSLKINSSWKRLEIKLNSDQQKAVDSDNSHILCLAGAGTGKTTTMVERIARLVNEEGYSGYDFLVLTFTRKAAQNMRTKLLSQRPQTEVYKKRIGMLHSLS